MGKHQFLTASINNSATIREKLGADITDAAGKAVMYDADGNVVLATDGSRAFGIVLTDAHAFDDGANLVSKAGTEVDVLIKYIGLLEMGGVVAKGDAVTINANGQGVAAASGDFVFGYAFQAANGAGELAQVQINRAGYAQ